MWNQFPDPSTVLNLYCFARYIWWQRWDHGGRGEIRVVDSAQCRDGMSHAHTYRPTLFAYTRVHKQKSCRTLIDKQQAVRSITWVRSDFQFRQYTTFSFFWWLKFPSYCEYKIKSCLKQQLYSIQWESALTTSAFSLNRSTLLEGKSNLTSSDTVEIKIYMVVHVAVGK